MNKMGKTWKIALIVLLVLGLVWILIISPFLTFQKNEKIFKEAVERYFELNPSEMPTGERVKTISLGDLYHQSYIKESLNIPYTKTSCSRNDSWIKVKRVNGEYQYYIYLKCGIFASHVDHTGPEIKLNGESKIQVDKGEAFTDPGVKSIVDKTDGSIDISKVSTKSNVNTSTVGTYEVSYAAYDSLNNKTVVKREVTVVQRLSGTVKESLAGDKNFIGDPYDNYIRLSNMLFRIYGVDDDNNVIVVADNDVAYVNYEQIEKWLDNYYYKHLNEETQKIIVEKEYCKDTLTEDSLMNVRCSDTTQKRKVYVPSVKEINNAQGTYDNFMKSYTISWTANNKNDKEAYVTAKQFHGEYYNKDYVAYDENDNCGIRPMMTIKGDSLITKGDGTKDDPYVLGDNKKAKAGSLVNERQTGEYLEISGDIYRIIEAEKDGTTKVIADFILGNAEGEITCLASNDSNVIVYDPKNKTSVAYFINNDGSAYVDTSYFVNHEVSVPVYKNTIIYGQEVETKKIKAKLSAPNMYEMFSTNLTEEGDLLPYWFINSSKANRITGMLYVTTPYPAEISEYTSSHVRVVGYLKKDASITRGEGTYLSPYIVK